MSSKAVKSVRVILGQTLLAVLGLCYRFQFFVGISFTRLRARSDSEGVLSRLGMFSNVSRVDVSNLAFEAGFVGLGRASRMVRHRCSVTRSLAQCVVSAIRERLCD